jgi:hypothetical protein
MGSRYPTTQEMAEIIERVLRGGEKECSDYCATGKPGQV